jgi:primase-polymerase (primpol)-like protein
MSGGTDIASIDTPTIRVPSSLAELDQWIVWRYEERDVGNPRMEVSA